VKKRNLLSISIGLVLFAGCYGDNNPKKDSLSQMGTIQYCTSSNYNQCPSGTNCFIQEGQGSIPQFCAKPCSVDSDCRTSHYHCREGDNKVKSCVPAIY
jgi:hypothetical protein